jgi:hypothetical protein
MGWAGHVAFMVEMRNAYTILAGKPEDKRLLEDTGVDGWIILERITKNKKEGCGLDSYG